MEDAKKKIEAFNKLTEVISTTAKKSSVSVDLRHKTNPAYAKAFDAELNKKRKAS